MPSDQPVLTGPGAPVVLAATWEIEVIAELLATLCDVDPDDRTGSHETAFKQIRSVSARLASVNSAVMSIADGEAKSDDLHQYARVVKDGCAVYSPDDWPEAPKAGRLA